MSRRITAKCKGVSLSITTARRTELRFGEGDLTELVRIDRTIGVLEKACPGVAAR